MLRFVMNRAHGNGAACRLRLVALRMARNRISVISQCQRRMAYERNNAGSAVGNLPPLDEDLYRRVVVRVACMRT